MAGLYYTALVACRQNDEMDAGFYLSSNCINNRQIPILPFTYVTAFPIRLAVGSQNINIS